MINQPRTTITITHIAWNDGRPRFIPSKSQRALGMTGYNLRHPDGTWFTLKEAEAESHRIHAEAQARRLATATGARPPRRTFTAPASSGKTLGELSEALFFTPKFQHRAIVDRKRVEKGLSPKTVESYRKCARMAEAACARLAPAHMGLNLWEAPANTIPANAAQKLLDEVHAHSGLSSARAVRAFLSQLWSRSAKEHALPTNIWQQLDKMKTPPGRVQPWEPQQFWHMVTTADAMGRPELADSFFLGALHGHRQADRLALTGLASATTASHITTVQSKTGVEVDHAITPLLRHRLFAALDRRKAMTVQWQHLIMDETAKTPWATGGDHYRHTFAEVRAEAARTMPSCASLTDQDLRDTNQTWLDRASVDPEVMALIAGHSFQRTTHSQIQKRHYVAFNQQRSDQAVTILDAYLQKHMPEQKKEGEA